MGLALVPILFGPRIASRLLSRLADVARHLVQSAGVFAVRPMDARGLLEHPFGVVAGLLERRMGVTGIALHLGLGVAPRLLDRIADVVCDLVQAAGLVRGVLREEMPDETLYGGLARAGLPGKGIRVATAAE